VNKEGWAQIFHSSFSQDQLLLVGDCILITIVILLECPRPYLFQRGWQFRCLDGLYQYPGNNDRNATQRYMTSENVAYKQLALSLQESHPVLSPRSSSVQTRMSLSGNIFPSMKSGVRVWHLFSGRF
jgi:hypothetical protein